MTQQAPAAPVVPPAARVFPGGWTPPPGLTPEKEDAAWAKHLGQCREKALQNLASARLMARDKAPYFRALLMKLVPREDIGLGTIATSKAAILQYDPLAVSTWSVKETAGGLIHEVFHLWNRHFERVGRRSPKKFNRNADRAINPGVIQLGLELPKGALFPKDLRDASGKPMPDGKTAEEYYNADPDDEDPPGGGCGSGGCGSCAGEPAPNEPKDGDPAARSDSDLQRASRQVSDEMVEHEEKGIGKLPAGWKRMAEESRQPPKVDWRQELAYAIRTAVAFQAGGTTHRYDMPGRRQAGIGYGNGKPVMPRTRAPIAVVALVADTSGSMGTKEMGIVLREAAGVMKVTGSKLIFCVCDASVHGLNEATSVEEMATMLKGGGGTDFVPAFDALMERNPRPDIIIYATDGYGRAPAEEPHGIQTIWALVGPQVVAPCKWGTVIRVKEDDLAEDEQIDVLNPIEY